jgi:RNA polymerase sigma-70 factor (ECF subfamily)
MRDAPAREAPFAGSSRAGALIALPIPEGDEALVAALRAGHPLARAALFDRHAQRVRRVLLRVLGPDQELPDLVHDVFITALTTLGRLDDPRAVGSFVTGIAIRHARALIRKRARRRILRFVAPEELHDEPGPSGGEQHHDAVRALYRVLAAMPADERIVFALRFADGMELGEVAVACGVSRATVCRRLARAERRFAERARGSVELRPYLEEGSRWNP